MDVELQVNNSAAADARFLTWAPSPCRIRVTNPSGATGPTVNVRIASVSAASGGELVFRLGTTGAFASSLTVSVPINGTSVPFFAAGRFGRPSVANGDVRIEARMGTTLVGSLPVMVRIRKNANTLTTAERDRFVAAFAQLNNQGLGRFADFRNMHTNVSSPQAHGAPGFLPWHRAYLLDLERELQAIDPGVALPYWRFDRPAPNLFQLEFLGVVQFAGHRPVQQLQPAAVLEDRRRAGHQSPAAVQHRIGAAGAALRGADPGARHAIPPVPDHGGQSRTGRRIPASAARSRASARPRRIRCSSCSIAMSIVCGRNGSARTAASIRRWPPPMTARRTRSVTICPDSMWPWNGVTGNPRPPTAPGGALAASPCVSAPGPQPVVRSQLDFQGVVSAASRMGFDYDDVAF